MDILYLQIDSSENLRGLCILVLYVLWLLLVDMVYPQKDSNSEGMWDIARPLFAYALYVIGYCINSLVKYLIQSILLRFPGFPRFFSC